MLCRPLLSTHDGLHSQQHLQKFAAPVFTSGLNQEQSRQLEMVQKKALAVSLGMDYVNYEAALLTLKQQRLDTRRLDICYKFALKCTNSHRHSFMFTPTPTIGPT